ncbi:DUF6777 domain-containing protein [Streptomyces sp. RG80]|uniref:DUF6777 domain-containing protein n=1 Tax=Streptomyces sp. RG80 TaxID=3157340 RepID=UPI00338F41DE
MRTPTGTFVTACALSAALIVAGCAGSGDQGARAGGEVFLQPAAAQGPDPFTDSTATSKAALASVTRTQQSARPGPRSISGGTPGLYGGTAGSGSCDVNRQIGHLAADRDRGRAFARVAGIPRSSIPSYLRSLTSVVLRADTQVTNHGYRDGRATGHQSVLQAGTAVLVDNRGVPRVRCACGNPLTPAGAASSGGASGRPWTGYRHGQVVVVTPAPTVVTHLTIIDIVDNTWIERRCGHDTRHDQVVRPTAPVAPTQPQTQPQPPTQAETPAPDGTTPSGPAESAESAAPSDSGTIPDLIDSASPGASTTGESPTPDRLTPDCVTPTVTVTPGVPTTGTPTAEEDPACPAATITATPPDGPTVQNPSDTWEEIGPETVPDTPDLPDGGGLIPDVPDEPRTTGSIFDSPTDVRES